MTRTRLTTTRRALLSGVGASAALLPWLRNAPALAGEGGTPPRLAIVLCGNDAMDRESWATGPDNSNQPLPAQLPGWLTPLQDVRDKLVVVGDLNDKVRMDPTKPNGGVGHHRTRTALTGHKFANGWAGGISVDQYIGQRIGETPLTLAVAVGQEKNDPLNRISYNDDGLPIAPYYHPQQAFTAVFGDGVPDDSAAAAKLAARRKSVLDAVAKEFAGIQAKLPIEDREKLEQHATLLRELENKFSEGLGSGCSPVQPDAAPDYDHLANANYAKNFEFHADLVAQAFLCGTTRVATIMLHNGGNGGSTAQWPEEGLDYPYQQHGISHAYFDSFDGGSGGNALQGLSRAQRNQIRIDLERYLVRRYAYLVKALDAIPEPGGAPGETLLDNSIVVWVKTMAEKHTVTRDLPHVIAGSAGGQLVTGRFVSRVGKSCNDLLVTLCNLMGLDDVQTFGRAEYCDGPLDID